MLAYCVNSPITLVDSEGDRPILSTSLRNETAKEKARSFEYMHVKTARQSLRTNPNALFHNGDNQSTYAYESDASVIARMLYGEDIAWDKCVDMAYKYIYGGIEAIPKPSSDFNYTYTHAYSEDIVALYPNGKRFGGTWFYNK